MDDPFAAPRRAASPLADYARPWGFAGGWAVDLWLGRQTREHQDPDLAILRADQDALRGHLAGWTFRKVIPGEHRLEPWPEGEHLELPVHEIHAAGPDESRLEFLLNEAVADGWRFRRNLDVALPLAKAFVRSPSGIPVLAPEIVLLYKAKNPRPKDEHDFAALQPRLDEDARRWLLEALDRCHPGHAWRDRLVGPGKVLSG